MEASSFALFQTTIGTCAIAWSDVGISAVQLPDGKHTRDRIRERFPEVVERAPSALARRAIAGITALLDGKAANLSDLVLDLRGIPAFHRQVYALARRIPVGATLSYGVLANRLGKPQAARAVGQALGRNPFPLIVPCHRILSANGKLTGFSAPGGVSTKRRLLQIEGITNTTG